ncbi:MAG: hypothetical protein HYR56_02275 [Acidobacteria bacterium]|nr:hypothetical protein [Acidobacteriota bacterium]MBI3421337.1 hypothetical protein [Acidobacteriota bacterium]
MKNNQRIIRTAPPQISNGSALVSDLAFSVLTGIAGVRRLVFRMILFAALLAAGLAFTAGIMLRDYLPDLTRINSFAEAEPAASPPGKPPPEQARRNANAAYKRARARNPNDEQQASGQ